MKAVKINPQFVDLKHPQTYLNHVQEIQKEVEAKRLNKGLFKVKTANEWLNEAKITPVPEMLFSEFWHENEICILFADSNLGKSILAVQIADSISKGEQIQGFKLEAKKQPVLYFDFELSAKQFEVRYSVKSETHKVFENHYSFDDNFKRIEINPNTEIPKESDFEKYLNQSIEKSIIETEAKVLIIDNITYLKTEMEQSKNALPLIQHLKALKSKYSLSILILAHTPKRDLSRPISQNDLQGSKMLFNFIDSCFAIGQSTTDNNMRYIKQIKARNTAMIYDAENVIVCQLDKPYNYLAFEFLDFGAEREHLKQITEKDRKSLIGQAKELSEKGYAQRAISKQLGISLGTVNKYLKL
ncbi:AAA family ATPase [Pseudozobellia sp. WGM2]|uniref:AAA family ATPase n=1 Tax=Pseudozobellia sp. WGM2 TaxID=2787625 RepID=UPI001ADF251E|nr:AAA family ATPase [Pseudozobellia sp. WGM2]